MKVVQMYDIPDRERKKHLPLYADVERRVHQDLSGYQGKNKGSWVTKRDGTVAQLVEHQTENLGVTGSTPVGTTKNKETWSHRIEA